MPEDKKRGDWVRNKTKNLLVLGGAAFAILCFYPFDLQSRKLFWDPFFNGGHFAGFFVLTLGLHRAFTLRASHAAGATALKAAGAAALIAFGVEIIQPLFGRSASFVDIGNGLMGVFGAFVLLRLLGRRTGLLPLAGYGVLVLLLQLYLLRDCRTGWEAIAWRSSHFPLIARFEEAPERLLWHTGDRDDSGARIRVSTEHAKEGGASLRIDSREKSWSAVYYRAGDFDWSPYRELRLWLLNPEAEETIIGIRIDDNGESSEPNQRFQRRFTLQQGWNEVRINVADIEAAPTEDKLDLTRIRRMLLYFDPKQEARTIFVDDVALLR